MYEAYIVVHDEYMYEAYTVVHVVLYMYGIDDETCTHVNLVHMYIHVCM